MSTEITRMAEGTRVVRRGGTVRGTVAGYYRDRLTVTVDGGGSDTAPAHFGSWRELTADELAQEALAELTEQERRQLPCTCGQGYTYADHCPDCAANLRLMAAGKPHGYQPQRGGAPTDAERRAAITREQLRQPHGATEAAAWLYDRGPRYDFASWGCEGCGWVSAADNLDELLQLVEHARYDHPTPAGIVGIKAPKLTVHADRLAQWLERSR